MKTVTVYRVDYGKKTRVPIGEDAIHIAVDNREARPVWTPPNAFFPDSGGEYSSAD